MLLAPMLLTITTSSACLAGDRSTPENAQFTIRSACSGNWSDSATWAENRVPAAGDVVQIRGSDTVAYDVSSDDVIRTLHVAGTLSFSREKSTRLTVGLLKIQPGDTMTEDGFACDGHSDPTETAADGHCGLVIGTPDQPIPSGVTATIRLAYVPGMDAETCPAIIACGGRWDVHGSPMSRTWVKLAADARPGNNVIKLSEAVTGWHAGDHVIITSSKLDEEVERSFRTSKDASKLQTEDTTIASINGSLVTLDKPLCFAHRGTGAMRSEIADLSRNVIVESADPGGVRGHTMYHVNSSGGISYAEFRHLGKQDLLGKYAIHFHLCHDSMRGSGVLGASIWDSANRWITVHGSNHLLVRDCVGYGSIGHGFFLEDGTEAYNVIDRNLAVHAYEGKSLPEQILRFDPNDGAGFWWAAARNTFVRNVSCENDQYGYHFEHSDNTTESFLRTMERPDGSTAPTDIRALPFYRFEDNESHCDGLYSFNFGVDRNGVVHGDRQHPFICRNLRSWETHYAMRPMVKFFLMDGLSMINNIYGVYHPDYDGHVYRNIYLNHVTSEPINRGHDDEDNQYGDFTYENLTLENCSGTLIQLTSTAPTPGVTGHFRNVIVTDITKSPHDRATVDMGTGTMNPKLENPVVYYFHDLLKPNEEVMVVSTLFKGLYAGPQYHGVPDFTGPRVKAANVTGVAFPNLLDPIDDLPPATMIRSVLRSGGKLIVTGITSDNEEVGEITVNGVPAIATASGPGLVDWKVALDIPTDGTITAKATDKAGNREIVGHVLHLDQTNSVLHRKT